LSLHILHKVKGFQEMSNAYQLDSPKHEFLIADNHHRFNRDKSKLLVQTQKNLKVVIISSIFSEGASLNSKYL